MHQCGLEPYIFSVNAGLSALEKALDGSQMTSGLSRFWEGGGGVKRLQVVGKK